MNFRVVDCFRYFRAVLVAVPLVATVASASAAAACVGDCSADQTVTVDEITTLVSIATAQRPIADCSDPNGDGAISIEEIVGAVGNSLEGCPRSSSRYLYPEPQVGRGAPLATSDVNNDGALDFVCESSVLLNNRDGSFSERDIAPPLPPDPIPFYGDDMALGDFDGDDETDYAAVATDYDILNVLGSDSSDLQTFTTSDQPVAVVSGDIDADGDVDLVVASAGSSTLSVYLNNGEGTFAVMPGISTGFVPALLEAADLTGDGQPEILVSSSDSPRLTVFRHDEDTLLRVVAQLDVADRSDPFSQMVVTQLDADGRADLLTIESASGSLRSWLGAGDGTFRSSALFDAFPTASAVAIGDFDGDQVADMAIGHSGEMGQVDIVLGGRNCPGRCNGFAAGRTVRTLLTGDFTGDGHADLALVSGERLTLVEGNGDGTFRTHHRLFGGERLSFWVGDLDRDPLADVLQGDIEGFTSFLQTPGGAFEEGGFTSLVPFPPSPPTALYTYIAIGDFDGDGAGDFATARPVEGKVHVNWGSGDGMFQEVEAISVGTEPRSVITADLNGDGRDDLLTANHESNDLTLLQTMGGKVFEQRTLPGGEGPYRLAMGDMDGDHREDIWVTNADGITIRLAGETRSFGTEKHLRLPSNRAFMVTDLNADGFADLVLHSTFYFIVTLGNGDGTFRSPRVYWAMNLFGAMQSSDANGDGHVDLFVIDYDSLSIFLGDGRGEFAGPFNYSTGSAGYSLLTRDNDGDGIADVFAAGYTEPLSDGEVTVLTLGLMRGSGCADARAEYTKGYSQHLIGDITFAVADLNADQRPDLVTSGLDDVAISLATANTELGPRTPLPDSARSTVAVGDFDADGRPDVFTASPELDAVTVYANDGAGNFSLRERISVPGDPAALLVADLNGDRHDDVVAGHSGGLTVLLASLDGHYANAGTIAAELGDLTRGTVGPPPIIGDDFDRNGTTDLAVSLASGIGILSGLGDGHFAETKTIAGVTADANGIVAGDFDEDGIDDLASTHPGSSDVTILRGQGDGTFTVASRLHASADPQSIGADDLDGDGHLDLVTADFSGQEVTVFIGHGNATFTARRFAGEPGTHQLAIADFDVDGDLDLITALPVALHAGMFLPCALPHDTRTFEPGVICTWSTADGQPPALTCE